MRLQRRTVADGAPLPGCSPLLSRIYRARGVTDASQLDYRLTALTPPDALKGVRAAADVLADAILGSQRVLVVGDYDADGATSTALAVSALRALGASSVDYLIPDRFASGYGLSP
ncbi:MAG: single-stranded-DNA-specific exonuclease RecJ, partial [Gammaproteobacteria bacterium]